MPDLMRATCDMALLSFRVYGVASSHSHRHAVGGQAARGVQAWCCCAGASSAAFRDYVSCLDDVYADARPSGVPPPVHERSHEDARLTHAPVPWQVVGSLQRLFHESILSIPSLPH